MAIRKPFSAFLLIGGMAAAAVVSLSAAPALAATTFTVSPGGSITAKAGTTTLKDNSTGTTLTCTSSAGSGSVKSGSGLPGAGIGSISSLTFSSCTGPLGLTFTVTGSAFPYALNATSYSSGVTSGTISGIHARLSGPGCSAVVDGTGASADNGTVAVTYTNSSGALAVLASGGNLHIYSVSGCFGLIHSGDGSSFSGTYTVSPTQTITSP
jgi:hypothetical protein